MKNLRDLTDLTIHDVKPVSGDKELPLDEYQLHTPALHVPSLSKPDLTSLIQCARSVPGQRLCTGVPH